VHVHKQSYEMNSMHIFLTLLFAAMRCAWLKATQSIIIFRDDFFPNLIDYFLTGVHDSSCAKRLQPSSFVQTNHSSSKR